MRQRFASSLHDTPKDVFVNTAARRSQEVKLRSNRRPYHRRCPSSPVSSPATMMASQLSLRINSRFRESSEALSDFNRSSSPESSQSIVSPQEARVRDWEDHGNYSPRAVVAGRLGELAIRGDFHQLPDRSPHQTSLLPFWQTNNFSKPFDTHGLNGSHDMPESVTFAATERYSPPQEANAFPTSAPAADARPQLEIPETPVKWSKQPSASPRKRKTPISPRSHRSSKSPPPSGNAGGDLLTWNDSEITGHNATDPDDDGYGINGIGFKPTAAIAWARSQKRQKQVSEWKNREAREAREKRRERRVGNDLDKLRTVQSGAIRKKVKFDV
ncbi:hypothetical protein BDW69DRAFT_84220 [Aspergillus filifer]